MRVALACLAPLALLGCYRSYAPAEHDGGPPTPERDAIVPPPRDALVPPRPDTGPPDDRLAFRRCEGAFLTPDIECATVVVPRLWDGPDGSTVEIEVQRIPAPAGRARQQIWVLQGGPGGSSLQLAEGYGPYMQTELPYAEIYAVDHRGVGRSDRLGCPQESELSLFGAVIDETELADCYRDVSARAWRESRCSSTASRTARTGRSAGSRCSPSKPTE